MKKIKFKVVDNLHDMVETGYFYHGGIGYVMKSECTVDWAGRTLIQNFYVGDITLQRSMFYGCSKVSDGVITYVSGVHCLALSLLIGRGEVEFNKGVVFRYV